MVLVVVGNDRFLAKMRIVAYRQTLSMFHLSFFMMVIGDVLPESMLLVLDYLLQMNFFSNQFI